MAVPGRAIILGVALEDELRPPSYAVAHLVRPYNHPAILAILATIVIKRMRLHREWYSLVVYIESVMISY